MSDSDRQTERQEDGIDAAEVDAFIDRWEKSGGSESANFHMFAAELCRLLRLPEPEPSQPQNEYNDYTFERRIDFKHDDGTTTPGRIDLYRRGCFVMEAKQSAKRAGRAAVDPRQPALLPEDAMQVKAGMARRGTRGWDRAMRAAKQQAEGYARALPKEHGWPPFILTVDVGHTFEIYADFSGQGKNYAQFPDREGYSIPLASLREPGIRALLRTVWTDPLSLDPTRRSAEVTRDIAERLARIARSLEDRKHNPEEVAEFLMRCLFTMFAEDVGLLPERGFEKLLGRMVGAPGKFAPALESLWKVMDEGGFAAHFEETVKRFNGSLFRNCKALALQKDEIRELHIAAGRDWRDVEPAIFGTLLERALNERERARLGAHYTPRAYVERLVVPTIIEPLRADWEEALADAHALEAAGDRNAMLQRVKDFHHKLCTTRVLDPACGTGNFLYVSLELMKRLEGEVLDALEGLGEDAPRFIMEGETVGPRQFYGLELNPRAVAIADLVLWIGYLKWQLRISPADRLAEPVLHAYGTIRLQDAILAYDKRELLRDDDGKPLSRWDGVTMKYHPITDEKVPDLAARVELYRYENPRPAEWPEADFIVGNPPFVAGRDLTAELGEGYAAAIRTSRPRVPDSADFVMYFWDQAATLLLESSKKSVNHPLRRFGFITTKSITQTFSRRVVEQHLNVESPLSFVYAIPNHPWLKSSDKAAVRISMSVAQAGLHFGTLAQVISEDFLDTDNPVVDLSEQRGLITSRFRIGARLSELVVLQSNKSIAHKGFMPYGAAFFITKNQAIQFGLGSRDYAMKYLRPYRNGNDINQKSRNMYTMDFHDKSEAFVRTNFPECYQYLLETVKPHRDQNKNKYRRTYWWRFGQSSKEMREALDNLDTYIATAETSKHRIFVILDTNTAPDQKIRVVAHRDPMVLALLSSRMHVIFSIATGGWQGVGNDPVYQHTNTFEPFPFLASGREVDIQRQLGEYGRKLTEFRNNRFAEYNFLTITSLYNVLERVRERDNGCEVLPLSAKERDVHEAGLVSVLKEIHDDIDCATFEAYGWSDLIPALVGKPGATAPSPHKTPEQEEAEEELLARLVALNRERAEEERRGIVHWLRPDYQIPKLGHKVKAPEAAEQVEANLVLPEAAKGKPAWPREELDRIRTLRDILSRATAPASAEMLSAAFKGRDSAPRRKAVQKALETLAAAGAAQRAGDGQDGESRYFIPR